MPRNLGELCGGGAFRAAGVPRRLLLLATVVLLGLFFSY
jgi:hypothetical protein